MKTPLNKKYTEKILKMNAGDSNKWTEKMECQKMKKYCNKANLIST